MFVKMKLDKSYYQQIIKELAKILLNDQNKIAQELSTKLRDWGYSCGYSSDDLNITITFNKKT